MLLFSAIYTVNRYLKKKKKSRSDYELYLELAVISNHVCSGALLYLLICVASVCSCSVCLCCVSSWHFLYVHAGVLVSICEHRATVQGKGCLCVCACNYTHTSN